MPSGGNNKLTLEQYIRRLKQYTDDVFEMPNGYILGQEKAIIINRTRNIEYFVRPDDFLKRYKKNPNYPDVKEKPFETKYTNEYCQELLNQKQRGFILKDIIYCENSIDSYCLLQCPNPNHKIKKVNLHKLNVYKCHCKQCTVENKVNEVKKYISTTKYEYIDFEYDNIKNKYTVHMRDENYSYTIDWNNLYKKNATPMIVADSNPYSTLNLIKYIELNILNYTYLSGEYVNRSSSIMCKCNSCNEEFDITWDSISRGKGCPYCRGLRVCDSNSFVVNYPDLAKEIDWEKNIDIDPNSLTFGSGKDIWFKCHVCSYSYQSNPRTRRSGVGCPRCAIEKRSGANNCRWNGGISEIYQYLRLAIEPWKFDTSDRYKGRCVLTNKTSKKVIHHLSVPFAKIVEECFDELGIKKRKTIGEFSEGEVKKLSDLCLKKHYEYGLGVVLHRELHNEFHSRYGNINNTRDQFIEFALEKGIDLRKTM